MWASPRHEILIFLYVKITPPGQETVLYNLPRNGTPGVVMDGGGNLYGTDAGGTAGLGAIYKLTLQK